MDDEKTIGEVQDSVASKLERGWVIECEQRVRQIKVGTEIVIPYADAREAAAQLLAADYSR